MQDWFGPFWKFKNQVFCAHLGLEDPIYVAHGAEIYVGEINPASYIRIADQVVMGPNVRIDYSGGLEIERKVTIFANAHILTHNHIVADPDRPWQDQGITFIPLKIGANAWIGTNAIIPQVRTIGKGAIVGAGAVVTKDVAPFSIVVGNRWSPLTQLVKS